MDEKLIAAIKEMAAGKEEGFNKVYSATYNHVYFRAKEHMHDEDDALDLVQIVFVEAFKNIDSLQRPEALYGWLDGITYRQGMKLYRKKKEVLLSEEGEGVFETLESTDVDSMPELSTDQKETSKIIREIIDELPEPQKVALIAYYFDNYSVGQIAEMAECSEGTIKSRLNYARQYIKRRVEEKEKSEGYRLHAFGLPLLWWAIKMLADDTTMSVQAAQHVYNGACQSVGLTATTISISSAASGAASAGTQAGAAKATGIGAKFAMAGTGTKALIIGGAATIALGGIGGGAYIATHQPSSNETAIVYEADELADFDLSKYIVVYNPNAYSDSAGMTQSHGVDKTNPEYIGNNKYVVRKEVIADMFNDGDEICFEWSLPDGVLVDYIDCPAYEYHKMGHMDVARFFTPEEQQKCYWPTKLYLGEDVLIVLHFEEGYEKDSIDSEHVGTFEQLDFYESVVDSNQINAGGDYIENADDADTSGESDLNITGATYDIDAVSAEFAKIAANSYDTAYVYVDDINSDGVPELFVLEGTCSADLKTIIYFVDNGNVYQGGSFVGGHIERLFGVKNKYAIAYEEIMMGTDKVFIENFQYGDEGVEEIFSYKFADNEDPLPKYEPSGDLYEIYPLLDISENNIKDQIKRFK